MRFSIALGMSLFPGLGLAVGVATARSADELTPKTLAERLAEKPTGDDASRLADSIRSWFGKDNLSKGSGPKIDGLNVAWALEKSGMNSAPRVVSDDGKFRLTLSRVGDTDVYAAATTLADGTAFRWYYVADGELFAPRADRQPPALAQLEAYSIHPDSVEQSSVPRGKLTQQPKWESKIYPGTTRDWWVYVPAQYKPESPACVMVFQDGGGYKDFVPTVFDNLISKGDMPVTVGIFINPGAGPGEEGRGQRSVEYDTLSDRYPRFLLEEILPEVEKTVKLRHDPASRAIAGISSGGICAWTVAWERPDEFSKVLSWVGSFTNIASGKTGREGGHNYEAMIRKTPKKPIRVFLQDGANDLDNPNGNWPLANQQMARSLAAAGYDYQFVYGQGFHSNRHGRSILPDSLRWLWRDYHP
jgi:enterochelin esterase-like enzyme